MKETDELLERLSGVIDVSRAFVTTEQTDWKGRTYEADRVMLDEASEIGLEVSDHEITVFYLREHQHFMRELDEGIVDQAAELLIDVFTCPAKYVQTYKGKALVKETFYLFKDGRWVRGCTTFYSLVNRHNLFAPKTVREVYWSFAGAEHPGSESTGDIAENAWLDLKDADK